MAVAESTRLDAEWAAREARVLSKPPDLEVLAGGEKIDARSAMKRLQSTRSPPGRTQGTKLRIRPSFPCGPNP